MFCPNCGSRIADGASFCPNCGMTLTRQSVQRTAPAQPVPSPMPAQPTPSPAQPGQANGFQGAPYSMPPYTAPQGAMPPQNPKKKPNKAIAIVGAVVAVLLVIVVAVGSGSSGDSSSSEGSSDNQSVETTQIEHGEESQEVTDAKEHAADVAENLYNQSQQIVDAYKSDDGSDTADLEASWLQTATDEYEGLENDLKVIQKAEQSSENADAYRLYEGAIQNMLDVIAYEQQLNAAMEPLTTLGDDASLSDYVQAFKTMSDSLSAMDVPDNYAQEVSDAQDMCASMIQAMSYTYSDSGQVPAVDQYSAVELLSVTMAQASRIEYMNASIDNMQIMSSYYSLNDQSVESDGDPQVVVNANDTLAPNLYPELDYLVQVIVLADEPSTVKVEAQIPGFTEQFSQQYDIQQGATILLIKPSADSTLIADDLQSAQDRQLNYTVTDVDSGKVLVQESKQVKVKSLYDFTWYTNSYGTTTSYDILAWMRPDCDEVSQINRLANEYFSQWTGQNGMAGYQYGSASLTLAQIAAIQKAISDVGVTYQNDDFTLNAGQSILTPDQVIQQKHGLCIETSLLMASCLQKLGIHALIILTPGHAQVAAELTQGGGDYVLLETTVLPYDGVTAGGDLGQFGTYGIFVTSPSHADGVVYSEEQWQQFLASNNDGTDGAVQVIDCDLAGTLGISGLAVQ